MKYKSPYYLSRLMRVLFTALVFAASTFVSSAQNGWQRITDWEAGFALSFPGRPSYEESTVPETGLPLETYSFYYNGNLLHIAFAPIAPAPSTVMQVNKLLSDIADLYARNSGDLLRQEKLPNGGRQFDNLVKMPNGTLHIRSRVYVRRGMTYTLSCGSYALDGIDERVAEQFFSSFSFIKEAPQRAVTARRNSHKKSLPVGATSKRWYTLRGPDSDFVAEFPGKPDYSVDTSSSTGVPLYQYRFFYGENLFSVLYRERSEPGASPEQELKQALKNYYAALPGWELLRQVEMPDGYLLEHRGMSSGYPILARTRLYLHGTRLYFVMSMTKNISGPNKDDVNRFFSSFRFL
ncbi:MAG TPA: hypothetical protein VHU19_01820 [Pyrinomonadaceae bacterium]|jgi:hypothetical protein|nr:hypothetical protein [Pyrinomonadaceae bacterium]